MPVIFEEVLGTVEDEGPAPGGPGDEAPAAAAAPDPLAIRRELRRRARRDARLHAD
jgi:hypothetical protein